jgi:serine/threonine-protein kinase
MWQIRSLGTNGTFLDGKLATQDLVSDGSILQLGTTGPILKFEIQAAAKLENLSPSGCTHAGNLPGNLFCIRCGQPIHVQRTIRDYQVLRMLGHGGMGTTFLVWAKQAVQGRPQLQVLKEINADLAAVPKAQELFAREARILQSLHHSGIPQFFDYFVEENKKYLVMELVHGQDLDKWVIQRGPVSCDHAISWMLQTCEVLTYLHNQVPPVIHRDLKPSNLLVRTLDNQIVVIDFGAVKEAGSTSGTRISVEGYSAPEQGLGRSQIHSDLYAVGATLIFLLTGQNPFKFYKIGGQGYQLQLPDLPNIPPSLKAVIERATKPQPADRYQTAAELAIALKNC